MAKIVLIVGLVWPEPQSSAAGTRMLQLIDLFKNQDYTIVFACAAQESEFSFDLKSIGVSVQKIKLNCASFDVFVKNLNPEIVLFDRYIIEEQFGWRVYENCPKTIRILDTEDLHCLRLERQNAVKNNTDFQITDLLSSDIAKREIASILRCDLTLVIATFEMSLLQDLFNIDSSLIYYLPLFCNSLGREQLLTYEDKKDFVFIGNFLHEPNYDAVKQLKEKIWTPIAKQIPEAYLHIYGAYCSQKVSQWHNVSERFLVHGRAESAQKVIEDAKILLAPIRFGAGIKGKLLEAMQLGTPSVTTSIGAEGICVFGDWNGFVIDDFSEFVSQAVTLYNTKDLWHECQEKGFEIISNKFDKLDYESEFNQRIIDLKTAILNHRKSNFIGNVLLNNNVLSVKYMSRWIEEKNKNVNLLKD